jgi:hypothetical protein
MTSVSTQPTREQIDSYKDIYAFSTKRSNTLISSTVNTLAEGNAIVTTKSADASYQLLQGALGRLDTLRSNLYTLQALATEASAYNTSSERKSDIYGMMRSLTTGIDVLVEETKFQSQHIFNGNDLALTGAQGTARADRIDMPNLSSSGENGLGLSRKIADAQVDVWYDDVATTTNALVGLTGLNVESSTAIAPQNGFQELSSGNYQLKITYAGPDSSVELYNEFGVFLERAQDVDLSGTGKTILKMDSGIELSFDKKNYFDFMDKYDYESLGSPTLRANLTYQRIYTHQLDDGSNIDAAKASVEMRTTSPTLYDSAGGTFAVGDISYSAGKDQGTTPLTEDDYQIEILYRGKNSAAFFSDSNGRMLKVLNNVDLSADGEHTLDFENGMCLTVDKNQFTEVAGRLSASIHFKPAEDPSSLIDFESLGDRITQAIATVEAQANNFYTISDKMVNAAQTRANVQEQGKSAGLTALFSSSNSALSLFGSSSGSNSIKGMTDASVMQMFQNTNSAILTQSGAATNSSSLATQLLSNAVGSSGSNNNLLDLFA